MHLNFFSGGGPVVTYVSELSVNLIRCKMNIIIVSQICNAITIKTVFAFHF